MSPRHDGRVVVLQSFGRPRPTTNPYLQLLARSVPADRVHMLPFSWRTALVGRWDVFHVHWPDVLIRGSGRVRTIGRQLAALALLLRIRVTGAGLVRTVHNVRPHEGGSRLEQLVLGLFDRWTTAQIELGPVRAPQVRAPATLVPHGHYQDWYRGADVPDSVPGRLMYFGLIRPYKGVLPLVGAFRELADPALSLRVAGQVPSPQLRAELELALSSTPSASGLLEHVDDATLAAEVGHAELVVLPYLEMGNSGAALLALSLGRPVLVPASESTRALAAEVGEAWVLTYDGELGPDILRQGLARARAGHDAGATPDLGAREWVAAGRRHADVYAAAPRRARRRARFSEPGSPAGRGTSRST
ncbi:glycosyltransferase [Angustibacter luteus]|uniref:Glycosyltransferase n=1 Tax=Angustibacter luteus TaxID=658456 RepID=A0ABW1JBY1_9ACTN